MVCYSDSFLRFLKKAEPKTFMFCVVSCMAGEFDDREYAASGAKTRVRTVVDK